MKTEQTAQQNKGKRQVKDLRYRLTASFILFAVVLMAILWIFQAVFLDKYYELARKYLPNGGCGVVSFCIAGGRKAAEKFMAGLKVAAIETHVADARTCCLHPASATHRQMNDDELTAAGISPDLVRLSVGLENKEDLIADLAQALA